jgi:hypothetical protein
VLITQKGAPPHAEKSFFVILIAVVAGVLLAHFVGSAQNAVIALF